MSHLSPWAPMWPILTNVTSNRKANAARFHLWEVPNQVKPNNIWVFIYYFIPYTAQVPYREPCHWPNYFVIGISDTHQHLSTTLSINSKLLCCGLQPHQTGLAPAFLLSSLLAHQPSMASVLFFTHTKHILPQGLCTCCFPCLKHSSFRLFGAVTSLLKCHLLSEDFLN